MMEKRKTLDDLKEEIRLYQPWTDKETWEKQQILDFVEKNPDCLLRGNRIAHMTASAWVVNRERTKVLMAYHKIYDSWAWLGGHADGEADLLQVAMKEACEEAGLRPAAAAPGIEGGSLRPVREEIFSMETLTVDGHVKHGSWVPSHLHLNLTYLLEADEKESLQINEEENSGVRWFLLEEALAASKEPWFVEHIYSKLIRKMQIKKW
ncbi:MAG: NUDIX hydrolase [Firmicutes bacterium]|nr:NUDIX hydrolase [Bacillota bacterium]MDD7601010.1 NUDIX hydrolase [Bacillota bacterium]MDY5856662.1 NUDIX hydrolase [Anaerovoracaceae bacterium]